MDIEIPALQDAERQKALKLLEPLLMFLYPRKDADIKRAIAGTFLWKISNGEPFKRTDGKNFCLDWSFEVNTYQVVKSELESAGVVRLCKRQGATQYRISKVGLKKIHNAYLELLDLGEESEP